MDSTGVLNRVASAGVRSVRFLYCDHGNVIRGKAAHASALSDFLSSGIGLTVAMQGFCLTEHLAPTSHLGAVGEIRLVPDPDTFTVLPYRSREARVLWIRERQRELNVASLHRELNRRARVGFDEEDLVRSVLVQDTLELITRTVGLHARA